MLGCRFFIIKIKKSRKQLCESIFIDHLVVIMAAQHVGCIEQP